MVGIMSTVILCVRTEERTVFLTETIRLRNVHTAEYLEVVVKVIAKGEKLFIYLVHSYIAI